MKIFTIDTYYKEFLNSFYQKTPEIKYASYARQKKALLAEQFGTADSYSRNLKKLGHEAGEFIVNNEILQKQWAKEHNIRYSNAYFQRIPQVRNYFKSDWQEKILEAQIKEFKPDIIYCQNLFYLKPKFLRKIKQYAKLLVGQIAYPLISQKCLLSYDLIISSLPHYVKLFRSWGIKSEYLALAFEPIVLNKLSKENKQYNVTHIGGYDSVHNERNKILETGAQKLKIDFWGYGVNNLAKKSPILKNYHGEVWGINMYNILYNSRITLTKHITKVAANYANNMRLYEATGCGCLLIADYKKNLNELFKMGKEIETYKTEKELIEKINYYLKNEKKREKIAQAGQERTLKDHTYEKRMEELVKILRKYL